MTTNLKPLKAEQIAPHFGVCKRTILNWYHDGIIPASVDIGRVLRFDLEAVRDAIEKATHNNSN